MRVFMLGWEFPPFISGGLGTACYGLTKAMDQLGIKVVFVLPKVVDAKYASHVKLLTPDSMPLTSRGSLDGTRQRLKNIKFCTINSWLRPYETVANTKARDVNMGNGGVCGGQKVKDFISTLENTANGDYSRDMYTEAHRYAALATELAAGEQFDIIHAHDWMTYPAGMAVAAMSGKPLVVHIHSTEFDRSGENVNQMIYDIERMGMHAANKVIAVSHFTRNIVVSRYGVPAEKVEVVHNGVERNGNNGEWPLSKTGITKGEKIILFMGRITMQKGPEYFLQAAKKVLDVMDNVKFVMAGSGDLMRKSVEMAAELGIGHKVVFTGFLRGEDVKKIYKMADLFVMPSVSEPFGIVPLEALENDVPVIISKQSGVSEVLMHALKVDFWDVNEIANKIVAVLKYPPLEVTLRNYGNFEVRRLRWKDSAEKCMRVYAETLAAAARKTTCPV